MNNLELRSRKISTPQGQINLEFLVCPQLEKSGFLNAFLTRNGGTSPFPKNSLNFSPLNDSLPNIQENENRVLNALNCSNRNIISLKQIHSDLRFHIKEPFHGKSITESEGDALASNIDNLLLGIRTADCLPIMIADPQKGVFAIIHAGWKGTLQKITEKMLRDLLLEWGVEGKNCLAALGPHACSSCYEVGSDVYQEASKNQLDPNLFFKPSKIPGKFFFNSQYANVHQLMAGGIKEENIFLSDFCTIHNNNLFFSHRVEAQGRPLHVGRMINLIGKVH